MNRPQAQAAEEPGRNVDELEAMIDQIISADTFFSRLENTLSEIAATEADNDLNCPPPTLSLFLTEKLNSNDIRWI